MFAACANARGKGAVGPAIVKPQQVFQAVAQSADAMQVTINALPFSPDLLIGKDRVAAGNWTWRDSLRGLNLTLASNTTAAEAAWPGYSGTNNRIEYASKISPKYLSVGLFTHTNGTPTNIDLLALGTVGYVVIKRRDAVGDWYVWHRSLTVDNNLRLNTTAAQSPSSAFVSVIGTACTFSGSAPSGSYTYEAYAHDTSPDGIVQCGLLDGDEDSTVSFPWTPQFAKCKQIDAVSDWKMVDTARGASPGSAKIQRPNRTDAELTDPNIAIINKALSISSAGKHVFVAIREAY